MSEWTKDDLAEFDILTRRASSRDQMDRISARLDIHTMEKRLGKPALDEMMEALRKWDDGEA